MSDISYKIYRIMSCLWRRRYTIIMPIILLPLIGGVVGYMAPKKYVTHTSILIQETAKLNPFLQDLSVSPMLEERRSALKSLLHSRHILGSVAEEIGRIDANSSADDRDRVINELSTKLTLRVVSKDLYKLEYRDGSPELMKETLESVRTHFVDQLLSPERSSIEGSENFLLEQLLAIREQLAESETELAVFVDENPSELPSMRASQLRLLDSLKLELSEKEAMLAGEQERLGGLRQQIKMSDPALGQIEEELILTKSELSTLLSRYKEGHSSVKSIKRKLSRLEKERNSILSNPAVVGSLEKLWDIAINKEVDSSSGAPQPFLVAQLNILQENQGRVHSLAEQIDYLQKYIDKIEKQTSGMGLKERDLGVIKRDIRVKRALYENLYERYEMAKVTGSLSSFESKERVKTIDKPYAPRHPTNPSLVIFIVMGFVGGIVLGIGFAVCGECLDSRLRWREQIEGQLDVRVISRIPAFKL